MAPEVVTVRVISGTAKGRKLHTPNTLDVRPATDRLKEALFNILFDVEGDRVLDLFAGSGSLAIEALSRGAEHATVVERLPAAVASIRHNVEICGFEDRVRIVRADVNGFVLAATQGAAPEFGWNLVFVDPPYAISSSYLEELATGLSRLKAAGLLASDTRIAFERRTGDLAPPLPDGFSLGLQRAYGQTSLYMAETASTDSDN